MLLMILLMMVDNWLQIFHVERKYMIIELNGRKTLKENKWLGLN
jgi:hypothetical protein